MRSRTVALNADVLDDALASPSTASFTLNLFDDTALAVSVERVEESPLGHRSWAGHIVDRPLSTVTLTHKGDSTTGMVTDGPTVYEIHALGGGMHRIDELDSNQMPPDRDVVLTPESPGAVPPRARRDNASPAAVSVVDVLVLYTSTLRAQIGAAQVESRIAQYIAETNLAYQRSGVSGQLRLVGTNEIPFGDPGDARSVLSALRSNDAVQDRRNALGADLVALLVSGFTDACGVAYLGPNDSAGYSATASQSGCVYTFAHEVGHNLGAQHATEDGVSYGPNYPEYARGYKAPNHAFRTIMAYACSTPPACPRVLNFSSTAVLQGGQATGTASQRNADRLNELLPLVAAYRVGAPPAAAPSAPQNLRALTNGLNLTLQWQPSASGGAPSNYALVAGTGPGLSNIGQASVGLLTSMSAALPPGTYFVRAYAQNGGGTSPPSNEVSFTLGTTAAPGPPRNLSASVVGNTLSLSWLPPNTGAAASGYLLDVGSGPGLSNVVAGLSLAGTSISAPGVPSGTYFIRIRARNAAGASPPSNEATAVVGSCTLPSAPQNFTFTKAGLNVALSWSPPAAGGPSFTYGLRAGTSPGASNLVNGSVGSTTSIGGTVPAGTYFVRVIAANACGVGPTSGELTITVP